MVLGLSTSWNAHRHTDGHALISEITALGFTRVELSFNLTRSLVDHIADAVRAGTIHVDSIHSACPIPEFLNRSQALPDYFSLASTVEDERKKAVFYAKRTIDTAVSLGGAAVVLHCGRVAIPDRTNELVSLYERGLMDTPAFGALRDDMVLQRRRAVRPFLDRALLSLEEINAHASAQKVRVGIETRYYYREIPMLDEFEEIFRRFEGSSLGYWHDTGHAQAMETLGFATHKDFLDRYAPRMIGAHIHDADGCRDHKAPLTGRIDFAKIVPYIQRDVIKVIEAHHPARAEDIMAAREYLGRLFDEHSPA